MGKKSKPKGVKSESTAAIGMAAFLVLLLAVLCGYFLIPASSKVPPTPQRERAASKKSFDAGKAPGVDIFHQAFKLYQSKDMAAAADAFRRYLKIQPKDGSALNNLGLALVELGEMDEAIDTFKKIVASDPMHADAYSNLGIAYQRAKRNEESIDAYKQALRAQPNHVNAANNVALMLLHAEPPRFQESIDTLMGVLEQEFQGNHGGQDYDRTRAMVMQVQARAQEAGVATHVRDLGSDGAPSPEPVQAGETDTPDYAED